MTKLTKTVSAFTLLCYMISIVFSLNFNVKYNTFLANQLKNYNGSNEMLTCKVHCFLIENKKIDNSTDSINDIGIERFLTDKHLLKIIDFYFSPNYEFKSLAYISTVNQHPKIVITPPPEIL